MFFLDSKENTASQPASKTLALSALGVVFGDIGTSPLYTMPECLAQGVGAGPDYVLGILSLIFWGLMIIVSLKYVCIVMNASNKGEGGIFALTALALGGARHMSRRTAPIIVIGFCGAGLFFGDSLITPAVSVLSAVEGLKLQTPHLEPYILPLSIVILVGLFLLQRFGTQKVGSYFGPIMLVWFFMISIWGGLGIVHNPMVMKALNPFYAIQFFVHYGLGSVAVIGSVILAFTGAEALYADMGHFGAAPIRLSWFWVVLPALTLNYFGQGALVLANPVESDNLFYRLVPQGFLLPMIVLAAAATIIASQAVISGAFSLTQQAIQLGYLPRMLVKHTSADQAGQIYVPRINWILCGGVLFLVMMFRSSDALANAYGLSVMGTMIATTLLVAFVARHSWGWSRTKVIGILLPFFLIDMFLFSSSITKVPNGGWLPLLLGAGIFISFLTWYEGREILTNRRRAMAKKLETFVEELEDSTIPRVAGTAVYMSYLRSVVPTTLMNNLHHNKVLHERVIILHVVNEEDPRVPEENRLTVKRLQHGFWQVSLHYGFMERPNVLVDLQTYLLADCPLEEEDTSFFIGHDIFVQSDQPLRPQWREKLFLLMANGASGMSDYFRIPPERVVEFGVQVKV